MPIAIKIITGFLEEYGSLSNYQESKGKKLDQEETHERILAYIDDLGVEEWVTVGFTKN